MDFLLINPPMTYEKVSKKYTYEAYAPALGILYIAAPLEKRGYKVKIIDFLAEEFTEEKLKVAISRVDVVGITVNSYVADAVSKIADFIKKTRPDIKLIIGGPHCTIQGKRALLEINADVSVAGEGEEAVIQIAEALEGKRKLADIHGVYYRENSVIKSGLPPKEIENLDNVDFPSRHLVKDYTYGKDVKGIAFFARGKVTSIVTTRGCPFNCRFCVIKTMTKKYRMRSAENVVKELEEIAHDYDSVFIMDDNFLSDKKRVDKIMDLLIEKKLGLDLWVTGVRVDSAEKKLFKKMKKAGVKSLLFGIESGSQEVLDFYNKRIDLDSIERAIKLSSKMGFFTVGNFIIGSPIERENHIDDTIRFAKKLPLDFAYFFVFSYQKGSPLWQEAFESGKIEEDELYVESNSRRGLGNFTPEELGEWATKAYRSFYFNPRFILSQLFRQMFVYGHFRIFQAGSRLLFGGEESFLSPDAQESI